MVPWNPHESMLPQGIRVASKCLWDVLRGTFSPWLLGFCEVSVEIKLPLSIKWRKWAGWCCEQSTDWVLIHIFVGFPSGWWSKKIYIWNDQGLTLTSCHDCFALEISWLGYSLQYWSWGFGSLSHVRITSPSRPARWIRIIGPRTLSRTSRSLP